MWHWGGTLIWGRSWSWAAGDTESSKRRNTSDAIAPGAGTAPLGNQLCLPGLSSSIDLEPGIFLNIILHSLRRYMALGQFGNSPSRCCWSQEQREDKKMYKCSCELLSGPCCWYWLPPETSSLAVDTWICVCRKRKDLFSLPWCLHFSAYFCQTALVLQVGQCYRSTFSETIEIWVFIDILRK